MVFVLGNGIEIPKIGLGTWQNKDSSVYESVRIAVSEGYRHIDTAEMYENEREIGNAIKGENLFVTSKIWMSNLTYEKAHKALQGSLRRLQRDHIDLYLIHWPTNDMDVDGTFRAFREMLDSGKVRAIGVSNFTIQHLKKTMKYASKHGVVISANQVEYHPGLNQQELLNFCREHDILLIGYSPLGRGRVLDMPLVTAIAEKYDKTPGQVSLRWLIQKGIAVIPKSKSKEHIRENLQIMDFELTAEEMEQIDALGENDRILAPEFAMFDQPLEI
ncbi:MAG: aldo/keto reductase [Candidatus Woesearchaeota archaeon]